MDASPSKLGTLCKTIERFAGRLAAVVVHLNDTYIVEERAADGLPGFARLIATIDTLRRCSQQHCGEDRVLVLHSGDFLAPSLLSKTSDKGATMTRLLNRAGVDYVAPGNHEFDHDAEVFDARMREAKFGLVLSNGSGPDPAQTSPHALWPDKHRPWVAITGIVGPSAQKAFGDNWAFCEAGDALQSFFADTSEAPFHLVLTHATRTEDLAMRDRVDFPRRSAVLGGHDHDIGFADYATVPLVFKNLANLKTVRVLLLIAGGDHGLEALYRRHFAMHTAKAEPPKDTPAARRLLLQSSKVFDRDVIDDWIQRGESRIAPGEDEIHGRQAASFTQSGEVPGDALAARLDKIPSPDDLRWWLLTAADHPEPDGEAAAWVEEALAQHLPDRDTSVLRDFSKHTDGLDATDESVRRGPTDFSVMVTECVRRHTGADVVILNSGTFRTDAVLPARLTGVHVAEAFLYDAKDAVAVHENFPAEWVEELINSAMRVPGTGAYPQVSRVDPLPPSCRLAIARYVLESPKCIDSCYIDFLERHWSSVDEARRALHERAEKVQVSVVEAVRAQIAHVDYPVLPPAAQASDEATGFVNLARELAAAYADAYPYSLDQHSAWFGDFRSFLAGSDRPGLTTDLTDKRDALRAYLREFAGEASDPGLRRLQQLHTQLVSHRSRFEDGRDYHAILQYAATDIAGWAP